MFERCIYFNTNALVRKLNSRWEKAFTELGFTPSHGYLMRAVLTSPNLTQTQLATALQLEKSTVTRFLDKLEKDGWLQREPSRTDQREKIIKPTDKAKCIAENFEKLGDDLYETMCKTLGKENLEHFVKQLRDINLEISKAH
ncbi:MAG: MarR family transcriptional regulator [Agarilytica sp.]